MKKNKLVLDAQYQYFRSKIYIYIYYYNPINTYFFYFFTLSQLLFLFLFHLCLVNIKTTSIGTSKYFQHILSCSLPILLLSLYAYSTSKRRNRTKILYYHSYKTRRYFIRLLSHNMLNLYQ